MNIVISDPKSRKAFVKKMDNAAMFMGKKIGQEVELGILGLDGYTGKITGGSDKQGFPMKADLQGGMRKQVYQLVDRKNGTRIKIAKRGNMISDETAQINLKVTKDGSKTLAELLGGEKEQIVEEKLTAKEKALREKVGDASLVDPKTIKGKIRR